MGNLADGVADVPPGAAFDAWRLAPDAHGAVARAVPDARLLEELCAFGLLAPTSHNTVPQRFRIDAHGAAIEVLLDRRFVLDASDPTGRQATISIGCAIENLVRAARARGLEARVELRELRRESLGPAAGAPEPLVPIARVRLGGACTPEPHWLAAMVRRKVVRAEFDEAVALPAELEQRIAALTAEVAAGLEVFVLRDRPTLMVLGKFQELADTTVFNRDAFARELGDWLLPNDAASPLGMRGREFGLTDAASEHFHRGLRREEALLPDEIAGLAKAANVGMRSASAVLVICADRDEPERWIGAGRLYEAIALELWHAGFRTAMHAAITEVDGPNLALRGRLRTLRRPTVVFRAGRPLRAEDDARPHASRPALRDVLLP